jgi:hypothetical protein
MEISAVHIDPCGVSDVMSVSISFNTLQKSAQMGQWRKSHGYEVESDDRGEFETNSADTAVPYFAQLPLDDIPNLYFHAPTQDDIDNDTEPEPFDVIVDGGKIVPHDFDNADDGCDTIIIHFLAAEFQKPGVLAPLIAPLQRATPFRFGIATETGQTKFWVVE